MLPIDTIEDLYPRYAAAWDVLLLEASARHVLTFDEFVEEMLDPRLEKHVVLDDRDRVVAMTTLTTDLDAIPWINPSFYRHRFAKQEANGTLFYLGYTFVDHEHRRSGALALMVEAVNDRLSKARGVIGFDICGWGMKKGIGRRIERMFSGSTDIITGDTQTYFVADYRHPEGGEVGAEYRTATLADRWDMVEEVRRLLANHWPAYTLVGGAGHGVDLEALLLGLAGNQMLLLDSEGELCGVGLALPVVWDGAAANLPTGWDDAIVAGELLMQSGERPNTLCVLSITVSSTVSGRGLAEPLIGALKQRAADLGAHSLITPLRPTLKPRYPLIPLAEYVGWTRADGQPFDPWIRVHRRLGADVLAVAEESMVVTGTAAEWESWLDTPLPGTGEYVIAGGLAPLYLDREADLGRYVEPNVWVRYPIG
ncbi:MAG TPA: hypothetical protein VFU98_04240 [Microlunatus sp.]|nr:hypothetical protein [Microlunatus sp.]